MTRIFLSILLMMGLTFGFMITDTQAARFGGGRSFGMSRSSGSFSRAWSTTRPGQNFSSPGNNKWGGWLGPLAGLAMGGLLAYLFMGHGLGSGLLSWLLLAGGILLLVNLIRSRIKPAAQYNNSYQENNNYQETWGKNTTPHTVTPFPYREQASNTTHPPLEFDTSAFLREVKVLFIRLQAAYDNKNLNDIREFSTPEVFAEIQLQLQERGNEANKTEVVSLEAELLDAAIDLASVRFSGSMKEDPNSAAAPFKELWHFRKDNRNARWLVAGIEQPN